MAAFGRFQASNLCTERRNPIAVAYQERERETLGVSGRRSRFIASTGESQVDNAHTRTQGTDWLNHLSALLSSLGRMALTLGAGARHSLIRLPMFFHFKRFVPGPRTKDIVYLFSYRTENFTLNVKSSSPEAVTQKLLGAGPLSFALAASQMSLLFLRLASPAYRSLFLLPSLIWPPQCFHSLLVAFFSAPD